MTSGTTSAKSRRYGTLQASYDTVYAREKEGITPLSTDRWPRNRWEALVRACPAGATRVLEIGCGNGTVLFHLADRCGEVTGTEISTTRCRVARANLAGAPAAAEILHANVEQGLDKPDGHYDAVLWADVIEHVVDVFAAMSEISRLLRPGGRLITATPNIAYLPYRWSLLRGRFPSTSAADEGFRVRPGEMYDGGHLHYFTVGTLKRLYRRHGVEPIGAMGFGRRLSRLRNLWPSLLSGAALVIGEKQ